MSFLDRLENKISPTTPIVDEPSVSTEPEKMSYLDRLGEKTNKTEENVLLGNEPLRVSGKLKMDDLEKNPEYTNIIREYMVRRKGVQFEDMDAEELVDKFTRHMRFFNVNEGITVSEGMFVSRADEETKRIAGDAYEIYDSLGNVFTNDGLMGAVDGVRDYMSAILTSPSTYVGLGAGKLVSLVGGKAAAQAIKKAAHVAGKEAAKKAGRRQGRKAYGIAYKDSLAKAARKQAAMSLGTTGAVDGGVSILQNYSQQGTEKETQFREEFSPFELVFSAVGGAFGAGAQLTARGIRYNSAMAAGGKDLKGTREAIKKHSAAIKLTKKQRKKVNKAIKERTGLLKKYFEQKRKPFSEKVKKGIEQSVGRAVPSEVIKGVFLGVGEDFEAIEGLSGGIAKIMAEAGIRVRKNKRITDAATDIIRVLDQDTLLDISALLRNETGLTFGEHVDIGAKIGNIFAASVSEGGKILNSASQMARQYNKALVEGTQKNMVYTDQMLDDAYELVGDQAPSTKLGKLLDKIPGQGYGLNIWKRLLVSAPQTTAANILGFGQYYVANTLAEVLQGATLYTASTFVRDEKTAKRLAEQSKALFAIQGVKLRNFADPYTTHDAYLALLETDDRLAKKLKETFAGGVRRVEERFNIESANWFFKGAESYTQMAQAISGVNIQDSWTKSQMFMTSLDKYLRLEKGKTLDDVLKSGDLSDIDDVVQGKALDDTLRSVFSKDYKNDKLNYFKRVAGLVEDASNGPLGYVLPFGRFMNNIVATAYQWNPVTGLVPMASHLARGRNIQAAESFSRAMVGGSALALMMQYDKKQQERGEAWNEMRTPSGDIVDVTNTFPFSLLKVGSRFLNRKFAGEPVSKELTQDLAQQLAIGQAVKDINFGSDVTKLVDAISRAVIEGDASGYKLILDALGNTGGNIASGYLRPFDPINKLAGLATESLTGIAVDDAIDRRQAQGFRKLGLNASRYVDNIFEGLATAVTGEKKIMGTKLTPAGREGDVYDPNPIGSSLGLKTKQTRTYADQVFAAVDLPSWKAGMYTGIPEFDAFVNKHLAPLIEIQAENLWKSKAFREGKGVKQNLQLYRKAKVKQMLADAKAKVKEYASILPEAGINMLKVKLDRKPNDITKEAARALGIESSIRSMTTEEVMQMLRMVEFLEFDQEN